MRDLGLYGMQDATTAQDVKFTACTCFVTDVPSASATQSSEQCMSSHHNNTSTSCKGHAKAVWAQCMLCSCSQTRSNCFVGLLCCFERATCLYDAYVGMQVQLQSVSAILLCLLPLESHSICNSMQLLRQPCFVTKPIKARGSHDILEFLPCKQIARAFRKAHLNISSVLHHYKQPSQLPSADRFWKLTFM